MCLDLLTEICKKLDGDDIVRLCATSKEIRIFQHDIITHHEDKILAAINNRRRYCVRCKKYAFNQYYYIMLLCKCIDSENFPYYHKACIGVNGNIHKKDVVNQICPLCLNYTKMVICDICS